MNHNPRIQPTLFGRTLNRRMPDFRSIKVATCGKTSPTLLVSGRRLNTAPTSYLPGSRQARTITLL
jgi:hypothetical protein